MTLNEVFVYYYSSNLSSDWERCGFCRYFFSQHKYIQNHWLNKTRWRMSRIRIFCSPKCWKWTLKNTQESSTLIQLTYLEKLIHDIKCGIRVITTIAIWVYFEKVVLFPDISNPKTIISKIIDIFRPVYKWAEIAFSGRQNAEN
jgi:hypothetical protein